MTRKQKPYDEWIRTERQLRALFQHYAQLIRAADTDLNRKQRQFEAIRRHRPKP